MRVALMVTCINDTPFPDTGKTVVTLRRRLGLDESIEGRVAAFTWLGSSV